MREEKFIMEYNSLIQRYKKAEEFLSSSFYLDKQGNKIHYKSLEEEIKHKEKWDKEFLKIVNKLSLMMIEYKSMTGVEMNADEKINGFCL